MRNYTTQMDAARKGIVTPEIEIVAKKENMTTEALMKLVAEGKVAICANKNHTSLDPEGVGSMLRTKINVNLGVSRDCKDYNIEMEKVMSAVKLGAEAIMDLSSHGNTQPFRQKLTHECPAMIGTVPVYDSVIHYQRDLATLTAQDFIDVVRLHAEDGVDFVTLHCGITRKTIEQIKKHKRKMNIVSRGGSLVFAWMCMTGEENPFYEHYDEILDICEEYDVTISLGDACRPGCLADATDVCQIEELVRLGELTKRAWDHNVQVMVEGPGHVPLDQVALMDFGAKKNIAKSLNERGCEVTVYPAGTKAEEIIASEPDGIMLSNGPGDPETCVSIIEEIKKLYNTDIPIFAICLGHQLMALANGAKTYKLKYGHRGGNHPVKDLSNNRVYISSQNHGYAVDGTSIDPKVAKEAFINVNDGTNEGLAYEGKNIFTVQFHPEACPGPQDSGYLFDRFMDMMKGAK